MDEEGEHAAGKGRRSRDRSAIDEQHAARAAGPPPLGALSSDLREAGWEGVPAVRLVPRRCGSSRAPAGALVGERESLNVRALAASSHC